MSTKELIKKSMIITFKKRKLETKQKLGNVREKNIEREREIKYTVNSMYLNYQQVNKKKLK